MPSYTDEQGRKVESENDLTPEQIGKAFAALYGETEVLKEEGNSPIQNVLEGAGLQPLAHPSTIPDTLKNLLDSGPVGNTINAATGMYDAASDRTGRYFDAMSDDPNALRAAQTMMAPIPGVGPFMENMDIGDTESMEKGVGNVLGMGMTLGAPKIPGAARAVRGEFGNMGRDLGNVARTGRRVAGEFAQTPAGMGVMAAAASKGMGMGWPMSIASGVTTALGAGGGRGAAVINAFKKMKNAGKVAADSEKTSKAMLDNLTAEKVNAPSVKGPLKPIAPAEDLVDRAVNRNLDKSVLKDEIVSESMTPRPLKPAPTPSYAPQEDLLDRALGSRPKKGIPLGKVASVGEQKIPTAPNPPSAITPLNPMSEVPGEIPLPVPDGLKSVNPVVPADTPKIIKNPGTPRSKGVNPRAKGINPRALVNKRKEL